MPRGTGTEAASCHFELSNSKGLYGSYLTFFGHLLVHNTHHSSSYTVYG